MSLEPTYRIEPCLLDDVPAPLSDLIVELSQASAVLGARLHSFSAASLADLVRVMNCYYSNLIEGHNTRPRDIERALADDLAEEPDRRDLQLEARAHIHVQREVDALCASGAYGEPASRERIRWLHRAFYAEAPPAFLHISHADGAYNMTPGEFRSVARHDVAVGRHLPPSSSRVEDFMQYFEQRYRFDRLGKASRIVAMAAAHHRLNYIHPFVDGNGRVSRLVSHAMALQAGIGAHGLWSISRGLARGLSDAGEYKRMMDQTDSPRRNDLDGRGNLSREALVEFVTWFCQVALDQVQFMTNLFDLGTLQQRLTVYVVEVLELPEYAVEIPLEVMRRGELARGESSRAARTSERTARNALNALVRAGLLTSETAKSPVRLQFTVTNAEVLFPRLFGTTATAGG